MDTTGKYNVKWNKAKIQAWQHVFQKIHFPHSSSTSAYEVSSPMLPDATEFSKQVMGMRAYQ